MAIKYVNLKDLSAMEIREIKSKCKAGFEKVKRDVKDGMLVVEVKKHEKDGKRAKYSVHMKLERGTSMALTVSQDDWELPRALHKTIDNLKQAVDHKYKLNQTPRNKKVFK